MSKLGSFLHIKTGQELNVELTEKLDELQTLGASYDAGKIWQAKYLAAAVFQLMSHEGNVPILQQLKIRKTLAYVDSRHPMMFTKYSTFMAPLTAFRMGDGDISVVPMCSLAITPDWLRTVKLNDWWNGDILETSRGKRITRRNLIKLVRNKDGGGHFDPKIDDADYQDTKTDFDPHIRISSPAGPKPLQGVHLATVRQIAWELEQTLMPVIANGVPLGPQ